MSSAIDFANITTKQVDQAMRAMFVGISRVLETCPRTDTCRVLLRSSARATIGDRGQVVYAAANACSTPWRTGSRAKGLDCVSAQWGQWAVHFDLEAASTAQLAAIGVVPMSPLDALAVGTTPFRENAIVMAFNIDRVRPVLEAFGYGPLVSQLTSRVIDGAETLVSAEETDLSQRLINLLAKAIGADRGETIDAEAPMVPIGLDSLQALELRRRVQLEFNHDRAVSDLLGGASIADVLAQLDTHSRVS